MRQAALTLGSAPDCGTFIYTLKVPHTHPPMPKSKGLTRPGFAMQSYVVIVSSTKEDPLLTVGYDCIQNTFLNTCHDMCSVCNKRSPHTSPFLLKLIRLNSLGFAVERLNVTAVHFTCIATRLGC